MTFRLSFRFFFLQSPFFFKLAYVTSMLFQFFFPHHVVLGVQHGQHIADIEATVTEDLV